MFSSLLNLEPVPALQSIWFYPHILVYVGAYLLAAALGLYALFQVFRRASPLSSLCTPDRLAIVTLCLLCIGLLMGALWGKQAWGHFWQWDIKEIWALVAIFAYAFYVHLRILYPKKTRLAYACLILNVILIVICYFGLRLFPAATASLHLYS